MWINDKNPWHKYRYMHKYKKENKHWLRLYTVRISYLVDCGTWYAIWDAAGHTHVTAE